MAGRYFVPMVRDRCCKPRGPRRTLVANYGGTTRLQLLSLGRSRDRGGILKNCKNQEEGFLAEIKNESGRMEAEGRCYVKVVWVDWVCVFAVAEFF
ncbi:uncharacterized protein DS421_5g157600 [Arachis hypogaea]|nr:uncharacterized protein DS421_5g157600 [Arachis hypogaea]